VLLLWPRCFEEPDEFLQIGGAHVAQQACRKVADEWIHFTQQLEARFGDLRPHHSSIFLIAVLPDKFERLEPPQEPRDIRLCGDHAVADGRALQPLGLGSAENAQHVVLRGSDAPLAGLVLKSALEKIGGAHQVEESLFFQAGKRSALLNLVF
jgi:hypothetical protein